MKLGSTKTIGGVRYECVSHAADGMPIVVSKDTRPKRLDWVKNQARQVKYRDGEDCRIVGLRAYPLKGVIVSLSPLKAQVTEKDSVFEGTITPDGIRKAPQEKKR